VRTLRRITVVAGAAALGALVPTAAQAHGIGGRADLPVPVSFFAIGAGIVIVASFVLLSALWTEPRLQDGGRLRWSQPAWLAAAVRVLGAAGLGGLGLVVVAGLADGSASSNNIAPVVVYVYFWLVIPFLSAVLGDWWRWISPWGTLSRWVNQDRPERHGLVDRYGVWPAVVAFFGFTWLELVAPTGSEPLTLAIAALGYTLYVVAAGYVAGPESGLRIADAFHNYNGLIAAIAPIDLEIRDGVGTVAVAEKPVLVKRRWLSALPIVPERKGLAAFVVAMIGTVTYDGVSGTEWWAVLVGELRRETWFRTLALVGFVALIGSAYWLASWAAARLAGNGWDAHRVARRFAHTLVPIGLAYAVAHYITLILFEGQLLLPAISDPFGQGWNLFGTADWSVSFFLSPEAVWYFQVLTIVAGHIAGVVLAHDRALADFGDEVAVRTQYAMLALMVALTSLGLFILAG
jgi:hypothetical protein